MISRGALLLIRLLPFRLFSANPFTDVARTVRDSPVIRFEIREKRDYVAIEEPDSFLKSRITGGS
jgi:hypothetical protein